MTLQEKYDNLIEKHNQMIEEIKEIKEQMKNVEKKDNNVWVPKEDEKFFSLDDMGGVEARAWDNSWDHKYLLYNNNVFKTLEEAEKYAEIDYQLKKLVFEINQEEPINWKNLEQRKFSISYDEKDNKLILCAELGYKFLGLIYFTGAEKSYERIKEEIGEENLIWYIKRSR